MKYFFWLILGISVLSVVGCQTAQSRSYCKGKDKLYNSFYKANEIAVNEAYLYDGRLYINYWLVYKGSDYPFNFFVYSDIPDFMNNIPGQYINFNISLNNVSKEIWGAVRSEVESENEIFCLSQNDWDMVYAGVENKLISEDIDKGVIVPYNGEKYVLLRNADGIIERHVYGGTYDEKIGRKYSAEEISEYIIDELRSFISDSGKPDITKVLVSVGITDDGQSPFIFVDLDKKYALTFNEGSSFGGDAKIQRSMHKGVKAADYLILNSHFVGLLARPFSYAFRLFNLAKDVTYDSAMSPYVFLNRQQRPDIKPINHDIEAMDLAVFENVLDGITHTANKKADFNLLVDGESFFDRLVESIRNADKTIDIRLFIFDNDDYAIQIADLLKEKACQGVKVRVLLDGMGQLMGEGKVSDDMPKNFKPPYSMVNYLRKDSNIKVRLRPNALLRADHTKTILIDNAICFTGGMNIGREYRYDWHDLMFEIRGEILSDIYREFNIAWAHAGNLGDLGYFFSKVFSKNKRFSGGNADIRLLYTRANDTQIYKAQLEAIKQSRKFIYINNAYFSDQMILIELIKARGRGVDVRVIFPAAGNHDIMNKSNIVTANNMFNNGIKVYFYPGMSHVKAAVYDGWLCAGSANFDKLSLRDNLELNIATSNREVVDRVLNDVFKVDFMKSKIMTSVIESGLDDILAEIIARQL